jgi:hypothetical protein
MIDFTTFLMVLSADFGQKLNLPKDCGWRSALPASHPLKTLAHNDVQPPLHMSPTLPGLCHELDYRSLIARLLHKSII